MRHEDEIKGEERTFQADSQRIRAGDLGGERAKRWQAELTDKKYQEELRRGHEHGLVPADSIEEKHLASTFVRGELPHFAGINTFLKAPYLENIHEVGRHEVAIVGC